MPIASHDPRTGETRAVFDALTAAQIDARIENAARAFALWRRTPVRSRSDAMRRAADVLDADRAALARTMTEEMGKTIASAEAEVEKCARACRFYATNAEAFLADEWIHTDASASFVRHEPLGPVLAVMPWNFPLWQVFRFAAPALVAGNVGLLKHASNVPRCALAIEDVFRRAGFPDGVFQTLLVGSDAVPRILDDRRVVAATLTGSEAAGASVAARAAGQIKPTVLELGGSDPFVVMPSCDLEKAVAAAVESRTLNNGQSCINAKRFIVHREVYDAFESALVSRFRDLRVGDPIERDTQIGPLALASVRDDVIAQVEDAVRAGARRLVGATKMDGPGYWFRPGVLAAVPPSARAFHEEVFGPVAQLHRVESIDEAIALANATELGLGASVWTTDDAEREKLVDAIEAGQVFVNAIVASDPRLPFGGVKKSGYGRELARSGMHAFVNAKTVVVRGGVTSNRVE
ncbi:MAG TPA: NAD-dependent succinate-semialdehyde dehydrogenase [Labilithrix sp.]